MIAVEANFKTSKADEAIMKRYGVFGAEAESAAVSAIMIDRALALLATRVLKTDYFLLPSRRAIFHAITEIVAGEWSEYLTDPIRLFDTIRRLGYNEVASDVASVMEYVDYLIRSRISGENAGANFISWCEQIIKAWSRRRMAALAEKAIGDALSYDTEIEKVYDEIETAIRELRALGARRISRSVDQIIQAMEDRGPEEELPVVPTGVVELDRILTGGGLARDTLTLLAARTSQGKTAFSKQIAINNCRAGRSVLWFPLEVRDESTIFRMRDVMARISFQAAQEGRLTEDDLRRRRRSMVEIASWGKRFTICQTAVLTPPMIWKEVSMAQNDGPVDLIVVDHLGLITPDQRFKSKNEEFEHYSRQLKLLASEKNIPIICPHQINREGEEEAEKTGRIELRHLRQSGALEQDADKVLIIQLPDSDGATEASYQVEITLAKQRLGRTGYFRCRFDRDLGIFEDLPESGRYGIPIKQKKQSRFTIVGGKKSGVVNGDPSIDGNEGQGMPF